MNKLEFFEKLLVYKQDSIKARKMKDEMIKGFCNGMVIGMVESYSILFPEDERFAKNIIMYSEESAIKFLKAKINELKK
jgi:hypothetical protein